MRRLGVVLSLFLALMVGLGGVVWTSLDASPPGGADPVRDSREEVGGWGATDNITLTLYVGDYGIREDEDGFSMVDMEGFEQAVTPGDPVLPHRVYTIGLPPDVVWSSLELEVISAERSVIEGFYDIRPGGPDLGGPDGESIEYWGESKDIVDGRNMEVYGSDMPYPESCVELLPYGQMRKWKFSRVDFRPVQYNPVSGSLTETERVTVALRFRRSGSGPAAELMDDSVMDGVAQELLVNYGQVRELYRGAGMGDSPSGTYDYVIITTNAIEVGSSELADFVAHKEGRGHSVLVVTEDEFGGLTGQAPNHRAEKIRQWLVDNYAGYGIENVLLIGDPSPYERGGRYPHEAVLAEAGGGIERGVADGPLLRRPQRELGY